MSSRPSSSHQTSVLLIIMIWIAGLGSAAQFAKISVVFPTVAEFYSDAGSATGFLLSLIGFVGIIFGVIVGLIVEHFSAKKLLCGALVIGALASAYQATLPSLGLFLLSRIAEGFSHLLIVVTAPTLIASYSAREHIRYTMTLWGSFFGIAFAILAFLGVPLVANYGLSALFWAHSAYMLIMALMLLIFLPNTAANATHTLSLTPKSIIRQHLQIYRSPTMNAAGIGWLFYASAFVALLTLLPDFVAADQRTFVTTMMPLTSIISSLVLGSFLLRFFSAVRTIQIGYISAIVMMAVLALAPGNAYYCVALAGCLGLVQGASFAAVPELNDSLETKAKANGAMAQMGNLGTTMGTPLLLVLITSFGYNGLVFFAVALCLLGATAHYLLERKRAIYA